MRNRVYIYIPGILCDPGEADGWTDRAVTWTHVNSPFRGEKYEYWSSWWNRRPHQQERAEKLARMLWHYEHAKKGPYEAVLVAHSNGCDILLRALRVKINGNLTGLPIAEIHLFAAAAEADMKTNGIPELLRSGRVYSIRFYQSGQDARMRQAALSQKLLGWAGLGYGTLGGVAPNKLQFLLSGYRATVIAQPNYGHSTWFERGERFEATMRMIMGSRV